LIRMSDLQKVLQSHHVKPLNVICSKFSAFVRRHFVKTDLLCLFFVTDLTEYLCTCLRYCPRPLHPVLCVYEGQHARRHFDLLYSRKCPLETHRGCTLNVYNKITN
jgi:hypothetical protein